MKIEKENANNGFVHSQPVPRIFKTAAKILRKVKQGEDSLKNLVYSEKHVNIQTVYGIILKTLQKFSVIDELITKSQLFIKEPRFDQWLARILICDLLFGKGNLQGESKPVQTILSYEKQLREILPSCSSSNTEVTNFNVSKPRYVRVNTLKISVKDAVNNFREEGWILKKFFSKSNYSQFLDYLNNLQPEEFMIDPHVPSLLIFPPKTEFYKHPACKSKNILLQDKASCLPVQLLNPAPNSVVLDMCAAPGMKTTQSAAMLGNSGIVYAVELDKNREKLLRELVESSGATCVKTILKDVMQVTNEDCPDVEYILVDPSCSGSGITDRIEATTIDSSARIERLKKLSSFQAKLLRYALRSFPKAKRVIYSTCSINSEENEDVVRQVLETCEHFKLINAKKLLPSWNSTGSEIFPVLGEMCIYSNPEHDKMNGFFIAVFERLENGEKNPFLNVQLFKMFKRRAQESAAKKASLLQNTEKATRENKEDFPDVRKKLKTEKEIKTEIKEEILDNEDKPRKKKHKEGKCEKNSGAITPKTEEECVDIAEVDEKNLVKKKHKKSKKNHDETPDKVENTLEKPPKKNKKRKNLE